MENTEAQNTIDDTAEKASEKPAAKKTRLIIIVIILALLGCGYFVYQSLPSTKAGKLVKQALIQMESKDYAKAVEILVSARDTSPGSKNVTEAFFKVFEAHVNDILSKDGTDIVHALKVYENAE